MAYMISPTGEAFETKNPEYHKDSRAVTFKEYAPARKAYLRKMILKHVKPGSTVYTKCNHVANSGMSRDISVYVVAKDKTIWDCSAMVADLCGYRRAKDNSVKMGGCGMDMGFAIVYALGGALWPKGTPKPHGTRNGEPDTSGGYALKHRWL
jgi:hypothetical protein